MLSNKTKCLVVFNNSNIECYIDDQDYSDWMHGAPIRMSAYIPANGFVDEGYLRINSDNVLYIKELRDSEATNDQL